MLLLLLACTLSRSVRASADMICKCPFQGFGPPLFNYSINTAARIVRAKLLSETMSEDCETPPCRKMTHPLSLAESLQSKVVFRFQLIATYKGQQPRRTFTAESFVGLTWCGVTFQGIPGQQAPLFLGKDFLLNMASDSPPYFLWLCQFHRVWDSLTTDELGMLSKVA